MNKFIFDVDGTLTPSRQTIDPEFKEFFKTFIQDNKVWLATGSDYAKTVEQLGADITESVVTCYNCSGSDVWFKGKRVNSKSFNAPTELYDLMNGWLQASPFPARMGRHIEERPGMINFSIVGRGATSVERKMYVQYDNTNRERESIAYEINSKFENITATVGGETGIDIAPTGADKSQILADFDTDDRIIFFGDRTEPGGNDYPLVKANKRGINYQVKDWHDTWSKLNAYINNGS